MPRYIDAEQFSERFDMMCDAGGVLAPVTEAVREMIKKIIKAEPTADVEPARHGRWNDTFDGITPVCTVCGRTHSCFNRTPEFCPNCGAKMDGGVSNGANH